MNNEAYAWAAGFFDAEGSVCISKKHVASMSLGGVAKESVQWFSIVAGCGSFNTYKRTGRKTFHVWCLTNKKRMQEVIKRLLPYSITKAAELAAVEDHLKRIEQSNMWAPLKFQWQWCYGYLQALKEDRKLGSIKHARHNALRIGLSKPERIAWAAGLIDGEGCLYIDRGAPFLKVSMCDPMTVSHLAALWPEGSTYSYRQKNRKYLYHIWRLRGPKVIEVLQELRPNLFVKRAEANVLLSLRNLKGISGSRWHALSEELKRLKREAA